MNATRWTMALVLGLLMGGCLASEADLFEESGAGLGAAPSCEPADEADAAECAPGSARCCMEDDAGGRVCRGGSRVDTEAECLAEGGIAFYGSSGECERKCPGAEPMPVE